MRLVADSVYLLRGFPRNVINVYLVGDVLVDSGTAAAKRRILSQLRGRDVAAHALTHAHPDHFGASHAVCEALGIPLWCGETDAAAVEAGRIEREPSPIKPLLDRVSPHAHPVARRLSEGDEVAGFRVLDAPGHSPGHVAYWRESDRTLICGDVYFNLHPLTGSRSCARRPTCSPTTRRATASRCAGWPSSSRRWCCSGTARRSGIRSGSCASGARSSSRRLQRPSRPSRDCRARSTRTGRSAARRPSGR